MSEYKVDPNSPEIVIANLRAERDYWRGEVDKLLTESPELLRSREIDILRDALKQTLPLLKAYNGDVWGKVTEVVEKALGVPVTAETKENA